MSLKVPYASLNSFMEAVRANLLEGVTCRLYVNAYSPIDSSVFSNFTEATFDGYAPIVLTGWGTPALNASNKSETSPGLKTWTKTAGATSNTVYGYYVEDGLGNLLYAERLSTLGTLIDTTGQTFNVTPKFTTRSEF